MKIPGKEQYPWFSLNLWLHRKYGVVDVKSKKYTLSNYSKYQITAYELESESIICRILRFLWQRPICDYRFYRRYWKGQKIHSKITCQGRRRRSRRCHWWFVELFEPGLVVWVEICLFYSRRTCSWSSIS